MSTRRCVKQCMMAQNQRDGLGDILIGSITIPRTVSNGFRLLLLRPRSLVQHILMFLFVQVSNKWVYLPSGDGRDLVEAKICMVYGEDELGPVRTTCKQIRSFMQNAWSLSRLP